MRDCSKTKQRMGGAGLCWAACICLLLVAAVCDCHDLKLTLPSADTVLSAVSARQLAQEKGLRAYSATRHYTLRNTRFDINASMSVKLEYTPEGGKKFTVTRQDASEHVRQRVFEPLLHGEAEESKESNRGQASFSPHNYRATVLGQAMQNGRDCWVIAVEPRHRSRFLIKGQIWVDKKEMMVVHLQGRPSSSLSFWVGEPLVTEDFAEQGGGWFPVRMVSQSSGFLLGTSDLTIDFLTYRFAD